jgi:osmoprotectant transport system permease protein
MGFFGDVFDYLTNHDQWHGNESIPNLAVQHVQLTIVSVLVAAIVALPIGILLGHVRTGGALAVNIANIGRALPAFALLILAVQWVGIGDPTGILTPVQSVPAFIAMFALAVPPMLANAYVGMASVDDEIRESARGMGMNARQMIWRVELPNAVPLIMAGVRTATVAVVATATLAAYVDSGGFGRYIVDGFAVNDNVKVFAGGLLVALLAISLEMILALVQRAITSPGIRDERKIRVRDLGNEQLELGGVPAL